MNKILKTLGAVGLAILLSSCVAPSPEPSPQPSTPMERGVIRVTPLLESGERIVDRYQDGNYGCNLVREYISGPDPYVQDDAPSVDPGGSTSLPFPPGVFKVSIYCASNDDPNLPEYEGHSQDIQVTSDQESPVEVIMNERPGAQPTEVQ